jgi:hypothetical protein
VAALAGVAVTGVAAGSNHSLALAADGRVWAWGHAEYMQMTGVVDAGSAGGGDLGMAARHFYIPRVVVALAETSVVSVSAGGNFSAAITNGGEVVTWGWNAFYCLGRGFSERYLPDFGAVAGLNGSPALAVACGYNSAAAVTEPAGDPHAAGLLAILAALKENDDLPLLALPPAPVRAGTATGREGLAPEQVLELAARSADRSAGRVSATARLRLRAGDADADAGAGAGAGADGGQSDSSADDGSDNDDRAAEALTSAGVPAADVLFVCAAAAAPAARPVAAPAQPALASGGSGSGGFAEARAMLERALPALRKQPEAAVAAAAATASTGADAGPAAAGPAPRNSVGVHAAVVAPRCAELASALASARARPGAAVAVAAGAAACTWHADEARWHVVFCGGGGGGGGGAPPPPRAVLAGLAAYLYGDVVPVAAVPAHRQPALAALAAALALPRLEALCAGGQARARADAAARAVAGLAAASGPRAAASASASDAAPRPPAASAAAASTFARDFAAACPAADSPPPPLSFSDVLVRVRSGGAGGGDSAVYAAHRVILCRAAYFRAQLFAFPDARRPRAGAGGAVAEVELGDADPAVFGAVLAAMYSGDITAPAGGCARPDRALAALALASRLCLVDISRRLQDAVCDAAAPEDGPVLAEFAETHAIPQLACVARGLAATAAAAAAAAAAARA